MAAIEHGALKIARDPEARGCSAFNRRGNPCGRWAIRGTDLCWIHSKSEEEQAQLGHDLTAAHVHMAARRRARREIAAQQAQREQLPSSEKKTLRNALLALTDARQLVDRLLADGTLSERPWWAAPLVAAA